MELPCLNKILVKTIVSYRTTFDDLVKMFTERANIRKKLGKLAKPSLELTQSCRCLLVKKKCV